MYRIHHPFLLSDNRHYTFYVWRLYLFHPLLPYTFIPVYLACGWAWFLRIGECRLLLARTRRLLACRQRSDSIADVAATRLYDSNSASDPSVGASVFLDTLFTAPLASGGCSLVGFGS